MGNLEMAWEAAARIQIEQGPKEKLEDVVTPGSLASYVPADAWEALREKVRKIESAKAEVARVIGKLSEVTLALAGFDSARPKDAARLADALLAGEPIAPEPEAAKPEGLASLGREALLAAKAGLQSKRQDLESEITWLAGQLKQEEAGLLRNVLKVISNRYLALIKEEVVPLHVLIDGAHALLTNKLGVALDVHGWRGERLMAPPYTDATNLPTENGTRWVATFTDGAGIPGIAESWRRAVKAALGVTSL